MLPAAAHPIDSTRVLPTAARALPGANHRRLIAGVACLVVAGGLSFWGGTTYQHNVDQPLITQYSPASSGSLVVPVAAGTASAKSSSQSGTSGAPSTSGSSGTSGAPAAP